MLKKPKISVIFPAYNAERFISAAVSSILGQTFSDFELILIDDGSTDGSPSLIKKFLHDPRVRFIRNEPNQGLIRSLNLGIKHARADLCARMDADDISLPNRFADQYRAFQEDSSLVALGSAYRVIDERGRDGPIFHPPQSDALIRWSLCFFSPIAHPVSMFKRKALESANGYDLRYLHAEDYDLFIKMSRLGRLKNLNTVHGLIRKYRRDSSADLRPEYIDNAILLASAAMKEICGVELPSMHLVKIATLGQTDWPPGTGKELSDHVLRLLSGFRDKHRHLREIDEKLVRRDAAYRMLSSARNADNITAKDWMDIVLRACLTSPAVVGDLALKVLNKILYLNSEAKDIR